MQIAPNRHLTYCTNIHPANGWIAVQDSLARYAPSLKAALSPDAPFGIGLRLSGQESRELLDGEALPRFKTFLDDAGLTVFTMNGFPYGPFHKQPVKDRVHAPDWRDPERVAYTLRLIESLAYLLPEGMQGSISTSPLSYKPWFGDGVDSPIWTLMTRHVTDVAEALVRVRRERGQHISLALEPEPDGLLETSEELVRFFQDWLLPVGGPLLAQRLGTTDDEAGRHLLDHIQVCWDTCHVAVAFEAPDEVLARYRAAGIQVGKVQLSAALRVLLPDDRAVRAQRAASLQPFVESTYLHQVVQRDKDGRLRPYRDLDVALPAIQDPRATEWRIHFHVPLFLDRYGDFETTQQGIVDTAALLAQDAFTRHLEIETYTWDVLPEDLKQPLGASIRREFEWVLGVLQPDGRHA